MAVCFTYKLWGTAGGPGLEHTTVNVPQAVQKINQKLYFHSGFTSHRRLTPINCSALFLKEMCENWKPTGRGNHRCASEHALFLEETWGNWKQRNY